MSTEEDHPDWPDLSEKEDVIETIRLCFQYYNKAPINELEEHYRNILYQEAENDFVYYPAPEYAGPGDVDPGEDSIMSLSEFVNAAVYLWENATNLTLDISQATWTIPVALEGCDDCWTTTRAYAFAAVYYYSGDIVDSGRAGVAEFIVRPQYDDPEKWAIYMTYGRLGM